MLTSGANQYLHPDYLSPLPTTLDAKKSPLALLAQTCSQIGADPPSNKSLFSSSDKSCGNKSCNKSADRERNSPCSGTPTGRICEKASTPEQQQQQQQRSTSCHSNSGRSRTPGSTNKRCSSNQSASSSTRTVTPQGGKTAESIGPFLGDAIPSRIGSPMDAMSSLSCGRSATGNGDEGGSPVLGSKSSYSPAGVLAMTDPALKDLPLGTFKLGLPPSSGSTAAYPLNYHASQLPLEAMSAGSSLLSQHHTALKNGLAACNPYLSYANRLKSPTCSSSSGCSDSSMTPAVCRDPYCTGCQLNSHLLAAAAAAAAAATSARSTSGNSKITVSSSSLAPTAPSTSSSCPAGCVQCDHNNKSSCGSSSPYALAAAAYAHAQLTALAAASQLPYVCNWMSGDTVYCGKRFSTSDELLQHLRNHTNSIASTSDPSNAAAAAVATATALSILSPPLPPPPSSFPLSSAHPFFSRTYPTPPLSPLATARYHPYGKSTPPLLPPSLSSLGFALPPPHGLHPPPSHTHPYFSAYSLYGAPRLGAASGLHQ